MTSPPAFPTPPHSMQDAFGVGFTLQNYSDGMTLRDYFAAKAMTCKFGKEGSSTDLQHMSECCYLAECCYQMADAMLKARNQ